MKMPLMTRALSNNVYRVMSEVDPFVWTREVPIYGVQYWNQEQNNAEHRAYSLLKSFLLLQVGNDMLERAFELFPRSRQGNPDVPILELTKRPAWHH